MFIAVRLKSKVKDLQQRNLDFTFRLTEFVILSLYVGLNNCAAMNSRKSVHFYNLNAKIYSFRIRVYKELKTYWNSIELVDFLYSKRIYLYFVLRIKIMEICRF